MCQIVVITSIKAYQSPRCIPSQFSGEAEPTSFFFSQTHDCRSTSTRRGLNLWPHPSMIIIPQTCRQSRRFCGERPERIGNRLHAAVRFHPHSATTSDSLHGGGGDTAASAFLSRFVYFSYFPLTYSIIGYGETKLAFTALTDPRGATTSHQRAGWRGGRLVYSNDPSRRRRTRIVVL
ncbi:hypothetical protein BJV74DRAFT_278515 [Russula compacta]|nr:hypothetical protein BJV74DRAFT_278515 [Russula compacta]